MRNIDMWAMIWHAFQHEPFFPFESVMSKFTTPPIDQGKNRLLRKRKLDNLPLNKFSQYSTSNATNLELNTP